MKGKIRSEHGIEHYLCRGGAVLRLSLFQRCELAAKKSKMEMLEIFVSYYDTYNKTQNWSHFLLFSIALRRARADAESVNWTGHFLRQYLEDGTLPLNACHASKAIGDNVDFEMGLALWPRTDMAGMKVGFVDDFKRFRFKGLC